MALPKIKKKDKVRIRSKNGLAGAPIEDGFDRDIQYYFQLEVDRKEVIAQTKTYIKNNFNKEEAKYILENPDWNFSNCYRAAAAFWSNTGLPSNDEFELWKQGLDSKLAELVQPGKALYQAKLKEQNNNNVVSLSPHQRLQLKIQNTIMDDIVELEESWILGKKTSIDVYTLWRTYGLPGSAVPTVRKVFESWLLDYEDAYEKRCEQAVEGYSHLKRAELKRRIDLTKQMLADLDRIQDAAKNQRKARAPKAISLDKQIAKLKYKKEDMDYKITSIPPVTVINKHRLFVFNVKTRKLTEYIANDIKGLSFKGTTLQGFDIDASRTLTLRKPHDILPDIVKKTPKQLDKVLEAITTKPSKPNGRINEDTILLRII